MELYEISINLILLLVSALISAKTIETTAIDQQNEPPRRKRRGIQPKEIKIKNLLGIVDNLENIRLTHRSKDLEKKYNL